MSDDTINSRRRFIRIAVVGMAAAPLAGMALPRLARAQEDLPHLKEDDPTAIALGYKHDIADVDKEKYKAQYKEGDDCLNCAFYTDVPGSEWGPCTLFPGKAVARHGWCAGHALKA